MRALLFSFSLAALASVVACGPAKPAESAPHEDDSSAATKATTAESDAPAVTPSAMVVAPPPPAPSSGVPYDKEAVEIGLKRAARQVKANCGATTGEDGKASGPWGQTTVTVKLGHNGHSQGATVGTAVRREAGRQVRRSGLRHPHVSTVRGGRCHGRLAHRDGRARRRALTFPIVLAYDYDLVVLGGGPAGEKGAVQAAYFGKRVLVVEREAEPGGAAVHTGTLPSKTLRETAIFLSGYRQRELYGVRVALDPSLAVPRLLSRKNAVRELEVARIRWNFDRHSVDTLRGVACFVDPHTVEVNAAGCPPRRVTSEFFLVATGSAPFRPDNIPFDDEDVDDSDTILEIDRLPTSLTVIGGGVIGCEYATMFAAMHVQVTLVDGRERLLPFLDLEMGERLRGAMAALEVQLKLGVNVVRVAREAGRGIVTTLDDGTTVVSEKLLFAAGRSGRTAELALGAIGVAPDKRGSLAVDDDYRTTCATTYAAGDVIGFPALASTSMEQARVAVCHAFGFSYKRQMSHLLPYGIYTIPEVSCVGLSEQDTTKAGATFVVGRAFYRDNARGKIIGDKDGVVKLVFDVASRKLIGCHCIGDRASELVHLGQLMIALGGTVDTLIESVFNYPTLAELFKYAAYDALGALGRTAHASVVT